MVRILYRQRFRIGPWYTANASRSGLSHSWKAWPVPLSWNSRRRRIRLDLPGPFSGESSRQYSFIEFALIVMLMYSSVVAALVTGIQLATGQPVWHQIGHAAVATIEHIGKLIGGD